MRWKQVLLGIVIAASTSFGSGCVARVYVPVSAGPPPPPRAEIMGGAPSENHLWVAGHWRWDGARYEWEPGHWVARPSHGAAWVAGHWQREGEGWIWVEGHWRG